jgi:hypothetical protein
VSFVLMKAGRAKRFTDQRIGQVAETFKWGIQGIHFTPACEFFSAVQLPLFPFKFVELRGELTNAASADIFANDAATDFF